LYILTPLHDIHIVQYNFMPDRVFQRSKSVSTTSLMTALAHFHHIYLRDSTLGSIHAFHEIADSFSYYYVTVVLFYVFAIAPSSIGTIYRWSVQLFRGNADYVTRIGIYINWRYCSVSQYMISNSANAALLADCTMYLYIYSD
jgi:hypothetical protein